MINKQMTQIYRKPINIKNQFNKKIKCKETNECLENNSKTLIAKQIVDDILKDCQANMQDYLLNITDMTNEDNTMLTNHIDISCNLLDKSSSTRRSSRDSGFASTSNDESTLKIEKEDRSKTKYRTELCKFFEIKGSCKFGDNCSYAHEKENLRNKIITKQFYRTKRCFPFFTKGWCPYGSRCQFSHSTKTITYCSYLKNIQGISNTNTNDNTMQNITRPRLNIFKEVTNSDLSISRRLYEDILDVLKGKEF